MGAVIAFISGVSVSGLAIFLPHARNTRSSIDEFESFQKTLATLPTTRPSKSAKH
jgi:hypothetical protein